MNTIIKKTCACLIVAILVCVTMTGCGNRVDKNGSQKAEDGRSYGGLVEAQAGDKVSTVFFDCTVTQSQKCGTYQFQDGLYMAGDGKTYLVVTLEITNTYDKDLPMSITDFTLDYSEKEDKTIVTGYGNSELGSNDFMDNVFTLKQGETIKKSILFTVPDRAEYILCYKEYYEDKFEGDSYEIRIVPEVLEPQVTTESTEASSQDAETPTEETATEEAGEASDENTEDTQEALDDTGIIEE
ncbi:MAG: DUF4352 domain-containing protein [Lachnospiraceae bacterium]|nr:DUF4352 domain-containing protein [Lachnospiraceae bacterium]